MLKTPNLACCARRSDLMCPQRLALTLPSTVTKPAQVVAVGKQADLISALETPNAVTALDQ